jgi:hypothetical protein
MIGIAKNFVIAKSAEWHLPADGEWNCVVYNNYQPQCTNLNLMWFHNGGDFPRVMVKFCDDRNRLKVEFENLRDARECAPAVVPKALHFGRQGHMWGLWTEGVPGSVLSSAKSRLPNVLRGLTTMIASMHAASRRQEDPDPRRYRRLVQQPLEAVAQFGPSIAVQTGCSRLAAAISPQWLNSLPVIPQHGDLYSGNILSSHDDFYIVDWESYGAIDLPFYDLLTLLYSLLRETGETPAGWDPALTKLIPSLIRSYAEKLQMNPADVSQLLPLALANWFYLHLKDSRASFTDNMYPTIQQYFEAPEFCQRVFGS